MEEYLSRLHWLGMAIVRAAGGTFIKWTGDGFLAWFETPLYRDLSIVVPKLLNATWELSIFSNVTTLGIATNKRFNLSRGITYEQDAFLTIITYDNGHEALDLMGRSVVLVFRLCGIPCPHPCIVTQKEIVDATDGTPRPVTFASWRPTEEDRLKYFPLTIEPQPV